MRMKATAAVILLFTVIMFCIAACGNGNDNKENENTIDITTGDVPTDTSVYTGTSVSEEETTSSTTAPQSETTTTTVTAEQLEIIEEAIGNTEIDETNEIVITAEAMVGIPFAEGGTTPAEGFDNSGFIYYVLRENGYINCPRQTGAQSTMGENIKMEELKPGDLVFFSTDNSGNADFGGIYIGAGTMIYSPMPGQSVKTVDITTAYWVGAFATAVSLS